MQLLSILIFAVAVSLDQFCVGISYGIRKIRISPLPLSVLSLTSTVVILISMLFGHIVAGYVSVKAAGLIGAVILISVGLWILVRTWQSHRAEQQVVQQAGPQAELQGRTLLEIHLRPLGLVIRILKEPAEADLDKSGTISIYEAVLLGLALAMDSLGAGFGLAMTGFESLLTPVVIAIAVGLASFTLVGMGRLLGSRCAAGWLGDRAGTIQGWVLIGLGLMRAFKL